MDDNKDNKQETEVTQQEKKPDDIGGVHVQGHIKIFDPESEEVYVDKRNAIHYENMSEALALSVSNKGTGYISGFFSC